MILHIDELMDEYFKGKKNILVDALLRRLVTLSLRTGKHNY